MSVDKDGLSVGQPGGTPEVHEGDASDASKELIWPLMERLEAEQIERDRQFDAHYLSTVSVLPDHWQRYANTGDPLTQAVSVLSAVPADDESGVAARVHCPKCWDYRCTVTHSPATTTRRFLFWTWQGHEERLEVTCAYCQFVRYAPVGTRFMVLGS